MWSRFDREAMTSEGVYPIIWDEPEEDLKAEYTFYFHNVKQFISEAASANCALIAMLT
jgi:hypothetical protein